MSYRDDAALLLEDVKAKFPEASATESVLGDVILETMHGPIRMGNWGRRDLISIFPSKCGLNDPYGVLIRIGHNPDSDEEIIDLLRLTLMRTARVERRLERR